MTERVQIVISATDNASNVFKGVADAAEKAFRGMGQSVQNAGRAISNIGRSLTVLTAPLAAIGAQGVRTFAKFETVLAEIEARTGATGEQMDAVKKKALDMGAATAFSGTEAANAMLELLASGFSLEETFAALPAVLDAAAAGNIELGRTADIVTDALAMYGLEAEDARRVSDALSAGAGASSAEMDDLAEGLGNVGPIAKTFGLNIEDTVAILAAFSERGIKGAEAGTQLKSMLDGMSKTTPKVTAMWKELGISLFNAQGEVRPLQNVISELTSQMSKMTEQERIETLRTLAGSYGQLGLNILTSSDAMMDMSRLMNDQVDAATVAAARMDTLAGKTESFMGSVETLMITALEPFIENTLKPMIVQSTNFINLLNQWVAANPELTSQIVNMAASLIKTGPVLFVVGKGITLIGSAIASLFNPMTWLIGAFVALGGPQVLGNVTDALGSLTTALMAGGTASIQFQTTLVSIFGGELGNQIFFIVGNLTDMVSILFDMGIAGIATLEFWGELNDIFGSELGNRLHNVALTIFDLYLKFNLFVKGALIPFISQHSGTLIGIFTKVATILATAAIAGKIMSIGASIAALANPVNLAIAAVVLLWQAWDSNLGGIQDFTKNKVVPVIMDFIDVVKSIWIAVEPSLEKLITLFTNSDLEGALEWAKGLFNTFVDFLSMEIIPRVQEWANEMISVMGQWIQDAAPIVIEHLTAFGESIIDWMAKTAPIISDQLLTWAQAFLDWISPIIWPVLRKLGELASDVISWLGKQAPKIASQLIMWGFAFIAWIKPQVPKLLKKLNELATDVRSWVADQAPKIVEKLKEWGAAFVDWVVPALGDLILKLPSLLFGLLAWILEVTPDIIAQLLIWAATFVDWVGPALAELLVKLGELLGSVIFWILTELIPEIARQGPGISDALVKFVQEAITKVVPALWDFLRSIISFVLFDLVPAVWGAAQAIGNSIVDAIRVGIDSAWDGLVSYLEDKLTGGIVGDIIRAGGGIVGDAFNIAGFAQGGSFSGLGVVGEDGKELVYAPGGAMVIPNGQSEGIINNFNLTTNTAATSAGVSSDFRMMEAYA